MAEQKPITKQVKKPVAKQVKKPVTKQVKKPVAKQNEKTVAKTNVVSSGEQIVIDGTDLIAGRLSSNVAKLLRKGNRVSIVNCDKIMISGKKLSIVGEYKEFLKIASILHPKHGPFHPRRPDTIMKRMIRGMLPKEKPSKKTDLERLRTLSLIHISEPTNIGIPKEIRTLERTKLEKSRITRSSSNYTTMTELGKYIGASE